MSDDSRVRAVVTKAALAQRFRLDPERRLSVERALDPAFVAQVEAQLNTDYIDSCRHMEVIDALHGVLGPRGLVDYFAQAYLHGFATSSLLRTLVEGTLRAFGTAPGRLAKVMPRAWDMLSQNSGRFTARVLPQDCRARLLLSDMPPEVSVSGNWVFTFAGTFEGFLLQCNAPGRVVIRELDVAAGSAAFDMSWRDPSSSRMG